jgi:protease-4
MQNMVDGVYEDFTQIVSKGRQLTIERVKEIAEGRVYSGVQAKEIGLIDGFGGLEYSIHAAAKKAKIKNYRISEYPKDKDPFEQIFSALEMNTLMKSNLKSNPIGEAILNSAANWESIQGIQMRLPWSTDYH